MCNKIKEYSKGTLEEAQELLDLVAKAHQSIYLIYIEILWE